MTDFLDKGKTEGAREREGEKGAKAHKGGASVSKILFHGFSQRFDQGFVWSKV